MIHSRKKMGYVVYLSFFFQNLAQTLEFPSLYFFLLLVAVIVGLNPVRHNYTYYSFLADFP